MVQDSLSSTVVSEIVDSLCTTESLFAEGLSSADQCKLATEHCEAASKINFYHIYFCTLETSNMLFYPVGVSHSHSY